MAGICFSIIPLEFLSHETMRLRVRSAKYRTRTPLARFLAFVLLAGIVYGVTFGSAHSHGTPPTSPHTSITAEHAGPGLSRSRTASELACLLCLFHQNLSNSTQQDTFFVSRPTDEVRVSTSRTVSSYSASFASAPIARSSGRAPPLA